MEKRVVNCPNCSFSFLTVNKSMDTCPACNVRLQCDEDGDWVRVPSSYLFELFNESEALKG